MDNYSNLRINSTPKDQSGATIDVLTHVSKVRQTPPNQILQVTSHFTEPQPFALFTYEHSLGIISWSQICKHTVELFSRHYR
jgi:hypothetical protein